MSDRMGLARIISTKQHYRRWLSAYATNLMTEIRRPTGDIGLKSWNHTILRGSTPIDNKNRLGTGFGSTRSSLRRKRHDVSVYLTALYRFKTTSSLTGHVLLT
jgi:hypothetical protein